MGKSKRLKEQRKPRLTMGRGELKAYMMNVIDCLDDASYTGLCDLFLTACGVIDENGELTEQYANSPYWTVEGGKIKPSEHAKLLSQLSPKARETITRMGEETEGK